MSDNNLYNEEQFITMFLNIKFDDFLIDTNNDIVNSNEHYIQYKTEYLSKTNENLKKYKDLVKKFNELSNIYNINNNKYSYTFIDKKELSNVNKELKNLLIDQRYLYNNFMNYIQLLNSH